MMPGLFFARPELLCLLLLSLLPLLFSARGPERRPKLLWLQAAALACLVLALAGPYFVHPPTRSHHVLIVGQDGKATGDEFAERLRRELPYSDPFHVIRAGQRPLVATPGEFRLPASDRTAPDLAAALRQALLLLPPDEPAEILLYSDGRHAGGNLRDLAAELGSVRLRWQALQKASRPPVLTGLEHPGQLQLHEPFRLLVHTESEGAGPARIQVLQAGKLLSAVEVQLRPGATTHAIDVLPRGEGLLALEVQLLVEGQNDPKLGREHLAMWVEGRPRLLHLGGPERLAALQQSVEPLGLEVLAAGKLSPENLSSAQGLIVDDWPSSAWSREAQETVRRAVVEGGLGLLLAGAYGNLGPGGYGQSPLAKILPVEMPQREERRDPSTSLVIILDTSGSMGGNRVQLAKEVARLAIRRLLPHDKVGVVEFYGSKRWAAPLQPAGNVLEIQRALNRLQAGGGTIIWDALEEAHYALLNVHTRFRHILVLTDGGVETGPFEALARQVAEAGQTLSTVLIGPQGNSPFLMSLAQWGRGRFYACPSRFQLPDLRFKEPQSSILPAVAEGRHATLRPGLHQASASLGGRELPATLGTVEASLREGASLLLSAEGQKPLLCAWDQGAGRVAVLATDLLGPLAGPLRQDAGYGTFLADLLRSLSRGKTRSRGRLRLHPEGDHLRLELVGGGSSWPLPTVRLAEAEPRPMTPDLANSHVALLPYPPRGEGKPFLVEVRQGKTTLRAGAIRPLPRAGRAADHSLELEQLARLSRTQGHPKTPVPVSYVRSLILLALIAFLLSLLMRRPGPRALVLLVSGLGIGLLSAPLEAVPQTLQERIQKELAAKGQLQDLEKEWQNAGLAERVALARSRGDLRGAVELLKAEGRCEGAEAILLLEATGQLEQAQQAVRALLQDEGEEELSAVDRARWLLRQAELSLALGQQGSEEFMRQAAKSASDPVFERAIGHLAGSYGLYSLALELHRVEGTTAKRGLYIHLRRALWCERLDRVDEALAELVAAYGLARLNRDRRYLLARMTALMRPAGRLQELAQAWSERPEPDLPQLEAQVSLLRELGRGEDALALLERRRDLAEELQGQVLAIAVECGRPEQAVRLGRSQLQLQPKRPKLRAALALLLTDLRRQPEAEALLLAGVPLARGRRDLLLLGQTASELSLEQAFAAVLGRLRQSDKESNRLEGIFLELSHLRRQQQTDQATRLLEAASLDFSRAPDRLRIATALESLGQTSTAIDLYRKLYEETGAEDLGLRLAWLLSTRSSPRQQEEAYQIFKRVWLEAGSQARRIQAEERVLAQAARTGSLAELAIELEESLENPGIEDRQARQEALVKIYGRARDSYSAAEILRARAREPGQEVKAYVAMARMHLQSEEFIAHERCLQYLLRIDPSHRLDYLQELAMSALERGRPAKARQVLEELLDRPGPGAEIAFEFAAGIYSLAGRAEDATRVYRRSLALHPDRIETFLLLGNALRDNEQRQLAIGLFSDLLLQEGADDLFIVAVDGLLNMDAEPPYLRFAVRAVLRRMAAEPDRVYLQRVLQDLYEALGEDQVRLRSMEETVLVAGEQRTAFLRELMQEAKSQKKWRQYLRHGRALLAQGEKLPPTVFLELGEALLEEKDYSAAERAFARARLALDFAAVERRVAAVYEQARRLPDAERVRRRILRRDPKNPTAMLRLAKLLELRGAREEGFELYSLAALHLFGRELPVARPRPPRRGLRLPRNRSTSGDSSAEVAVLGALRCAERPAQLQKLLAPIRQRLEETEDSAKRWSLIQRLEQVGSFLGDEADEEIRSLEDQVLQAVEPDQDVCRQILDHRLQRGDLAGARMALLPLETGGLFDAGIFRFHLLAAEMDEAFELAAKAGVTEMATAVVTLAQLGEQQGASTLMDRLEEKLLEHPAELEAPVLRARRLLGRPVKETQLHRQSLQRALLRRLDDPRRFAAVVAALRGHPAMERQTLIQHLRQLLSTLPKLRDQNQLLTFLLLAKGLLSDGELLPFFEESFEGLQQTHRITQRLPLLGGLAAAAQERLLDQGLSSFRGPDRTMATLLLLNHQARPKPEVQRHLVAGLSLQTLGARVENYLSTVCTKAEMDPEAGRMLFHKLKTRHGDDLRCWVLGSRFARNSAQKQEYLERALDLLRQKSDLDFRNRQVLSVIAGMLDSGQRGRLLARIPAPSFVDLLLKGELLALAGREEEGQACLRRAYLQRPADYALLRQLLGRLLGQGRSLEALELFKKFMASGAQIYASHAGQLARIYLELGKHEEALAALDQVADARGSNLGLRLQILCGLSNLEQRRRELRAWLQQEQGSTGGVFLVRTAPGAAKRSSPLQALAPVVLPSSAPKNREEAVRLSRYDLLAFLPEGAEVARILIMSRKAEERDQEPGLYRAWLGSARRAGKHEEILRRARARLERQPMQAESLRLLFAAAQLGGPVSDAEFLRATRRQLATETPDLGLLAQTLLLVHGRKMPELSSRLLGLLLEDPRQLGSAKLRPYLPTVLQLAAKHRSDLLLGLLPQGQAPRTAVEGELLLALWEVAEPEQVLAGLENLERILSRGLRAHQREVFVLPYCGWLLRAGKLEQAKATLRLDSPSLDSSDTFSPRALACAMPKLEQWRQRRQVQAMQDFLLEELRAARGGRRLLLLRLGLVLALRLQEAGEDAASKKLIVKIKEQTSDLPLARKWIAEIQTR